MSHVYILTRGANVNTIAVLAAEGGHKDIVDDMLARGAKDFYIIAYNAAVSGHKDVVDDMIARGAKDSNTNAVKKYLST